MSSDRRRERRPAALRTRLITEQVALLALVCVAIVVVTEIALNAFLVDQLDRQLTDASNRAIAFVDRQPPPPFPQDVRPAEPIAPPGQGAGTISAMIDGGRIMVTRLANSGDVQELPSLRDVLLSVPVDGKPYERSLDALGEHRMMAVRTPSGAVVVTGLPLSDVDSTLWTVGLILGGVSLAGLIAAGVVGATVVRRTLRPLDRVAATATRVTERPLHQGDVALVERVPEQDTDPRTEVGKVGLALNRLLGHVESALSARHASETRVRQFVADASHELRTPLAAIRGYTELMRRRGDQVSPDTRHALERVESEARRMTTMVEDLLLLARLDAGRPLESRPVDLSRLVVDVVSDARVAGSDHEWRIELPAEPVTVPGDEARLHQVLANLLGNARAHTPAGTTVRTRLSTVDGRVALSVCDDGPGIPGALLPEVFVRFARGDSSRSRAAGGTGLGLAIVSAVVAAHRGRVAVSSAPGRTEFTVHLPRVPRSDTVSPALVQSERGTR
ncbi:two-component system OmpR family sensor kinase [Herbihabitans rhizosphaerae]|uniref:histidine kinase n=1 Tax=Herbihabitans rhizosphaerae TaxID=1872711 RepID=A0A4Q7KKR6_9PSEU|nr:ATP-binding protein [Herbihabitans rhizosphaerae]RZS34885.1 two-component system OmpR family sensor kinase [Herbihabitans rhizosphaerae]